MWSDGADTFSSMVLLRPSFSDSSGEVFKVGDGFANVVDGGPFLRDLLAVVLIGRVVNDERG